MTRGSAEARRERIRRRTSASRSSGSAMPTGIDRKTRPKRLPSRSIEPSGRRLTGTAARNARPGRHGVVVVDQVAAEPAGDRGQDHVVDRRSEGVGDPPELVERHRLGPGGALLRHQGALEAGLGIGRTQGQAPEGAGRGDPAQQPAGAGQALRRLEHQAACRRASAPRPPPARAPGHSSRRTARGTGCPTSTHRLPSPGPSGSAGPAAGSVSESSTIIRARPSPRQWCRRTMTTDRSS